MTDKRTILIFALLVALIVLNDIIIWLICREVYQKNVRNTEYNYSFYSLDNVESLEIKEGEVENGLHE